MTITNAQLIPELQYYLYNFIKNSAVNKYEVPAPVPIDLIYLNTGSIVELLFSDTFPYNDYTYLYQEESIGLWPELTKTRLMIYPGSKYLVPSSSGGLNFFNITGHDFTMLDALMVYRNDSTSLILIDTTSSLSLVTDATTSLSILYCDFDYLNTSLSKLIYLYLKLKIDEDYQDYNNLNLITDNTLLSSCFELKLIDEYFKYVSGLNITFSISCSDD